MASIEECVFALKQHQVIAYPTEGVFGLGCDPDEPSAIARLLQIKQRDKNKGLILIAANFSQLAPYIDVKVIAPAILDKIQQSWPDPVTWIVPKSERCSDWVSGQFDTVAVRVSDHPDVQALCHAFEKPVTSTSANLSGEPPCMTALEVLTHLNAWIDVVLDGKTGGRDKPSEIRDALSDQVLRQG